MQIFPKINIPNVQTIKAVSAQTVKRGRPNRTHKLLKWPCLLVWSCKNAVIIAEISFSLILPAPHIHEDGHWHLCSPFHTSSSEGNEDGDQSYHLLMHTWQHWQTVFLEFIPSSGRKSISLVQSPFSCNPTAELGTNTRQGLSVLSHMEQLSLGQGWSTLVGKRNSLLSFHLLWDVQMRTHQCFSRGKSTVWLRRASL